MEITREIYCLGFWISDFNRDFNEILQDFTPVADPSVSWDRLAQFASNLLHTVDSSIRGVSVANLVEFR